MSSAEVDVAITYRLPWWRKLRWDLVVAAVEAIIWEWKHTEENDQARALERDGYQVGHAWDKDAGCHLHIRRI